MRKNNVALVVKRLRFHMHDVRNAEIRRIAQTYLGKGTRYTEIVKLNDLKSRVL